MAVTSTIEYTTHRTIKDMYPGIDSYDAKERIYNWETTGTSNLYLSRNSGLVTVLFADGEDLGDAEANSGVVNANGEWYYDSDLDTVYYFNSASSPNDLIVESGEDASTLMTRMIRRSSRMVESLLDSRQSREIVKDREGNYPEFIQRAVGLKAITMLLKSNDPENPIVDSFEEEFNDIIEGYRSGTIQLPNSITADSSKGIIREVSVNGSSDLRLVELKGTYNSIGFDLIQIKVITGGVIGTATYSVWVKGNDKLKSQQVVTAQKITGDFDLITSNLYARWMGDDSETAIVTADDEWEISVHGADCSVSTSQVGTISLTRR